MQNDLSQIEDLKELKSMVYDQIAIKEQAEANIRTINSRITQLLSQTPQISVSHVAAPNPSVSDADLGIEDSAPKPDGVE